MYNGARFQERRRAETKQRPHCCIVVGLLFILFYCTGVYLAVFRNDGVIEEITKDIEIFEHEPSLRKHGGKGKNKQPYHLADGVIVLGMHRSGTSLVTGMLSKSGFYVGEKNELIGAAADNERGFFEMIDIVLANDDILKDQNMWYASEPERLETFDPVRALRFMLSDSTDFSQGMRGLKRLNDRAVSTALSGSAKKGGQLPPPERQPWALKDPRLCVTLRAWLPLFRPRLPAVLFTYRHPLEVAKSFQKRDGGHLKRWLKLWTVYNKMALLQSVDLCRVTTSHTRLGEDTKGEMNRIIKELQERCGLGAAAGRELLLKPVDAAKFFDPALGHQHAAAGGGGAADAPCAADPNFRPEPNQPDQEGEARAYAEAMALYCALEDGRALGRAWALGEEENLDKIQHDAVLKHEQWHQLHSHHR